jgi:DNA polymerase IIIc chi subunit
MLDAVVAKRSKAKADESGGEPRVIIHRLAGTKKALEACRLIDGLYRAGRRVVAWVDDVGRAKMFDEYLWTYAQHSFVPHVLWGGEGEVEDPVVVVTGSLANPNRADTLVVVDRISDVAAASAFPEIRDLASQAAEDQGRREAWEAAGLSVSEVRGVPSPRDAD